MFIRCALAAALLAAATNADAQEHQHGHAAGHEHAVTLIDGLGSWSQTITAEPAAQKFFDQGLRLSYGFIHDEAARSFEEALRLDPSCAMCAWGVAYALSPNINLPMSVEAETRALAAIRRAESLAGGVTARERAYIAALAKRFGEPAGADRAKRDSAYAAAMRNVTERYPDDMDAAVLYADAMLNLRPWKQWMRSGAPQPGTLEVVATLERVLERTANHAGACHFYIHTVEASPDPDRALPCAERLPDLMPGAGHIVHMPAHVYLRVGQYERAARANIAAVEADRGLFANHDIEQGIYPLFYHPHNIHFLWSAYMMSGQKAKAREAAAALWERVDVEMAVEEAGFQSFLASRALTHVRFGDWSAALAEPEPDARLSFTKAMWHYGRGVAHAAQGDLLAAGVELESLRAIRASVPDDMIVIANSGKSLLRIGELVLAGRIAAASGETDEAVSLLREAIVLENQLRYDEPPPWSQPVREVLGMVLLEAGRHAEAEAAFREDLHWMRESGWSLAGLERALSQQGKAEEARAVRARLDEAWKHADVEPLVDLQRVGFRQSTLPTGARIQWAESGDPAGTPVVLLHGYSDSWYSWSRVIPLLPESLRVIAPDLRGHGSSLDVPGAWSVDDMAGDVIALMTELGIRSATIVGHSLGSLVAQAIAATAPARVDGLVLIGAFSKGALPVVQELRTAVFDLPDPVSHPVHP